MSQPASFAVFGGGLAGLSSALALGVAGHPVTLYETRAFLGGRATSYPLNSASGEEVTIDNCQHILLRCCHNLIDFYKRLGVDRQISFSREFYWMEPGGRTSVMQRGLLPAPAHFSGSFAFLRFLSLRDKIAVAKGLLAVRAEYGLRAGLDSISMLDWLREKKQTARAIERFWRQVLVSAVNEELDIMAAAHGLQVFYLAFIAGADCYEMGVPSIPLGQLYSPEVWKQYPNVHFEYRKPLTRLRFAGSLVEAAEVDGERLRFDCYVLALPFEKLAAVAPGLELDFTGFSHVPITGVHLWFDRPITGLPHATFLDRTIQWMYNKQDGKYLQIVISASNSLLAMPRQEVIDLTVKELAEFFPSVTGARLERAHVVKEARATFSAKVGLEERRPVSATAFSNLFLAGDWTRSGWPATMEGAVRSGYIAAETALESLGKPQRFLHMDPR